MNFGFLYFRQQKKSLDHINYIWSAAYAAIKKTDISYIDYQLESDRKTLPPLINSAADRIKVLAFLCDLENRLQDIKNAVQHNQKNVNQIDPALMLCYIKAFTDNIDNYPELLDMLDNTQLSVFLYNIDLFITSIQNFCTLLKQVTVIAISATSKTARQLQQLSLYIPTFFLRILTTEKAVQAF